MSIGLDSVEDEERVTASVYPDAGKTGTWRMWGDLRGKLCMLDLQMSLISQKKWM